jgi:hypothetical protein
MTLPAAIHISVINLHYPLHTPPTTSTTPVKLRVIIQSCTIPNFRDHLTGTLKITSTTQVCVPFSSR